MNRIIVVGVFFFLLSTKGLAQKFSIEPDITIGGGYTSWLSRLPTPGGIEIDEKVYYEIIGNGGGGNMSIQFSPIFKLNSFFLGPSFGFQKYYVDKISFSPLSFELEADFENTFRIGILVGYDFKIGKEESLLITPFIHVGIHTFKPNDELYSEDLFKNKFYGSLGIGLSKNLNKWRITISPLYDVVISDFQFDNQDTNYLEIRVRSFNVNLGIGYNIGL